MRKRKHQSDRWTCLLALLLSCGALSVFAQESAEELPPKDADILAAEQGGVADKYTRLEKLMFRMAEYDTAQNPRRAALLHKAIHLSKEKHIRLQMETLVGLLNGEELNRAFDNQKEVRADLESLLELLSSEDRADHIKDQRNRYMSYIKEIERILRQQRDVQGRTEGGVDARRLAQSQENIAERTAKLDNRIREDERAPEGGESGDGKSGDGKSGDKESGDKESGDKESGDKHDSDRNGSESQDEQGDRGDAQADAENKDSQGPNEGKPDDGKPDDGKPGDRQSGESKDGKTKDGKTEGGKSQDGKSQQGQQSQDKSSEGQSSDGQPSDGQPSEGESQPRESQQGQPSQQDQPARKHLQAAEEKMREAQRRLDDARRDDAAEAQEQARRELEAAKAELEEILRQLREEEIERTLALLESRFRRMLEMQVKVYESTMRLDKIPLTRRDRHVDLEATKLSFQERRIVMEADKALALLQEEGSSVAFPESVEQMRDDMEQVVERLSQARIGRLTQGLEEDIIESLDEMVEAMKQAQLEQQQEQQQQQQQQQQSGDEEKPLVDQIAELKMLKALQLRINKRTNRYSNLLEDVEDEAGQAADDELVAALQRLADREARLQEITRDLFLGRNQ